MFWRIAADDSPVQNQFGQEPANKFKLRHVVVRDAKILPASDRFLRILPTRITFNKVLFHNDFRLVIPGRRGDSTLLGVCRIRDFREQYRTRSLRHEKSRSQSG
jgi:hypothetical protein